MHMFAFPGPVKGGNLRNVLFWGVIAVWLLHVVFVSFDMLQQSSASSQLAKLFDVDREHNVPTAYNGLLLLASGLAAMAISRKKQRKFGKLFWASTGLLFSYMAVDEVLILHEQSALPIRELLSIGNESIFFHAWVLIVMPLIVVLGLSLLVIWHLHKRLLSAVQKRLLVLMFFYATGVILLEILGTRLYSQTELYRLGAVLAEELLEITMASIILYTLAVELSRKSVHK